MVFVVAEAGSNHNGSLGQAMHLIEIAAACGADACKFQAFRADDLYPRDSEHWRTVKPLEIRPEWLPDLAVRCESLGIEFMASAFSEDMVDAIDPYVKRHKVASLEITDLSLLRHIASKGKPIVMSTGAATEEQRGAASRVLGPYPGNGQTWLHCVTAYPCPPNELSLLAMRVAPWDYGLSDHTLDPVVAPVMAVALGATMIEKHFTLSRSLRGPDHAYALEPDELRLMVEKVRLAEKMLGDGQRRIQPSEEHWGRWQHRDGGLRGE